MDFPFLFRSRNKSSLKLNHADPDSIALFTDHLSHYFDDVDPRRPIVFFCIGTDRSTGDALGPLVGTHLSRIQHEQLYVYGTLDQPVHAVNLDEQLQQVMERFNQPYIVAIDACLGQIASVGCIQIADGPVKPGAGVHKELPSVGDMHITGIVNVSGFMEYFVLQNTRLSQVYRMSEMIARFINRALRKSQRIDASFGRLQEFR